jgi:hypothetical protein
MDSTERVGFLSAARLAADPARSPAVAPRWTDESAYGRGVQRHGQVALVRASSRPQRAQEPISVF